MNIDALIKSKNYTNHEVEVLVFICKTLKTQDVDLTFEVDNTIGCAKLRPNEKKILIREYDSFSSVIHELLHAKLIFVDKYPDFELINKIRGDGNLIFFKQLIVDITNDLHHFIFYDEFNKFTRESTNVCFLENEHDFMNLQDFKFHDFLNGKLKTIRDKSLAIINSYNRNFIWLRYNSLLYDGNISQYEKIKNNIQIRLFHTLFKDIIGANKNREQIIEAYKYFFQQLNLLIK